jgi:hypothetical protein
MKSGRSAMRAETIGFLVGLSLMFMGPTRTLGESRHDEAALSCPLRIQTEQSAPDLPSHLHQERAGADSRLIGVHMFVGHPSKDTILVMVEGEGHIDPKTGNVLSSWTLDETESVYWVECRYSNTDVILRRSIGAGPLACTSEVDKKQRLTPLTFPVVNHRCRTVSAIDHP